MSFARSHIFSPVAELLLIALRVISLIWSCANVLIMSCFHLILKGCVYWIVCDLWL